MNEHEMSRRAALAGVFSAVGCAGAHAQSYLVEEHGFGVNIVGLVPLIQTDKTGNAIGEQCLGYVVGTRQDCASTLNARKGDPNFKRDINLYVSPEWMDNIVYIPNAELGPLSEGKRLKAVAEAKRKFAGTFQNAVTSRGCGLVSAKVDLVSLSKSSGKWAKITPSIGEVFAIVPDGEQDEFDATKWNPKHLWISTEEWDQQANQIKTALEKAKNFIKSLPVGHLQCQL